MQIDGKADLKKVEGPAGYFTGAVPSPGSSNDLSRFYLVVQSFTLPGARTAWHKHPLGVVQDNIWPSRDRA